jgi:AAA15 family ATPase/GTPase
MIKQIAIENFRCFGKTDIKDFQRVNLIGGLNNSGKTVLLEAILLSAKPEPETMAFLKNLRNEDSNLDQQYAEYTWDNFFLNRNSDKPISVSSIHDNNSEHNPYKLTLTAHKRLNNNSEKSGSSEVVMKFMVGTSSKPLLEFVVKSDEKLSAHLNLSNSIYDDIKINVNFLPVNLRKKPHLLAYEYSKLLVEGKDETILKAFQVIDPSIIAVNVHLIGGAQLVLKKANKPFIPLSLFGDAMNKIANIALTIAKKPNSILLIDEVENGIHHTAQREFWTYLFKIAKEFDVQVFATTHSLEMIKAFSEVAGKDFVEDAGYFELVRHLKTGEIVGIKHKIDTLEYEIIKKLKFRGEPTA